jgi:glucose/arabinose dehydrogenase
MRLRSKYMLFVSAVLVLLGIASTSALMQGLQIERIKLPPGFNIATYATGVKNAREMALSPSGILYVGSQSAGNVYAVLDQNKDYKADEVVIIASGLNQPSGVAFHDGALYVGEINRITRYDNIDSRLKPAPKPVIVDDTLPTETHHGWKFIAFGPDGML